MSTKKKIMISLVVTVVVIGLITGLLIGLKKKNRSKKTVDVYPVSEIGNSGDSFYDNSTVSGNVMIDKEQKVYLYPEQKVDEVLVKEGDTVKAGDVLLRYDMTSQKIQLDIMASEVELARVAVIAAQNELAKLKATTPVEPTTQSPTTEEPTTEKPTTEKPTTEKPTTEKPTTEEPTTEKPTTEEPTTEKPTTEDTGTEDSGDSTEASDKKDKTDKTNKTDKKDKTDKKKPTTEEVTTEEPDDIDDGSGDDFLQPTYTKEELAKAIAEKEAEIKSLQIDYQLQEVEYEIAKFRTENGEVLSNFDGVVKSVGDPDECIVNNEPYIVIGGDGGYTVRSYISELKLQDFSIGDSVTMMNYENGMEYTGKITEISDMPAEDYRSYGYPPQTYYPITISVDNTEGLSQNSWLEVSMNASKSNSSDTLYIEMPFVMSENGNYYVMKDVDGKLEKCYVKTGKIMWGSQIEIKGGVTMDDKLAFPYLTNAVEGTKTVEKSRYDMY